MILEGVLAIAALQLRDHSKSLVHQSRIISLLRENISQTDKESVLQNIIACMLLYQYEVSYLSTISSHSALGKRMLTHPQILTAHGPGKRWAFYLCGARRILHASASMFDDHQYDSAILMNWVHYHEVISGFSLRYWAEVDAIDDFCKVYRAIWPYELITGVSAVSCQTTITLIKS